MYNTHKVLSCAERGIVIGHSVDTHAYIISVPKKIPKLANAQFYVCILSNITQQQ